MHGRWNEGIVRYLFVEEDANYILGLKFNTQLKDSLILVLNTKDVFLWVLWHIWKARNLFIFENIRPEAHVIIQKSQTNAEACIEANYFEQGGDATNELEFIIACWMEKKYPSFVKCNISSSWINANRNCGVAWLAFPQFEALFSSIRQFLQRSRLWSIASVHSEGNRCARYNLSFSVTRDHRYQSYIARYGPSWLNQIIQEVSDVAIGPN
ncbi:hypothetical protein N665_0435s0001 [Sinapis alba]|nr:hypothetical protein N665_0435s0001 [Sinapis alba]